MNKRGELLVENIIFIVLNLVFLTILLLFVLKQGSGAIVLEQSYAKHIAMLIDAGQPEIVIKLDMKSARKLAEKNGLDFTAENNVVKVGDGLVTIRLSEKGGYSYSYFNDVDANAYHAEGDYYFIWINNYN